MKFARRIDLHYLIILLIISAYAWRFIPYQVIRSDGFLYFISRIQKEFFSRAFFYTGFELSAMSLGWFFSRLYGINISWYWWTAYVVMLITNALFFWLAITIFKKPVLAFLASLLFALNFFGNWDMYSTHCYCFILERIYPVLFLLPSAVFLHRFLERRNTRDFKWSLIFYFIGLGIGHWSVFITAFFLLYPICWAIFQRHNLERVKDVIRGVIYLGITLFFVLIQRVHEGFQLKWSPVDFLLHPQESLWPQLVVRQFVHWTQYPVFLQGDVHARMVSKISDVPAIVAVTPYIMLLYAVIFLIMYRVLPRKRALLVTTVVGAASIFFVNAVFGQYDIFYQPGSNRYLYYPNMLLVLFWTLFFQVLLASRNKIAKVVAATLIIGYVLVNMQLISESYRESMGHNFSTKAVFNYIQTKSLTLPPNTLVVGPYDEIGVYEATFFTEQLKERGLTVMSVYNTYPEHPWEREALTSANVVLIDYDKSCRCIREEWIKGGSTQSL